MQELPSSVSVYVPRMLIAVKQHHIKNVINQLNIGKVYYLDMHYRVNENSRPYYFAFISIQLYKTASALEFHYSLIRRGTVKLVHDIEKNHYWEVKLHVEKPLRIYNIEVADTVKYEVDYKEGLEKEFDELMKEVYLTVLLN